MIRCPGILDSRRIVESGGASSPLLTGLVSYWKLDESSGNAADSHGSNTGSSGGVTYGNAGKINNAFTFSGASTSRVNVGNPTNLQLTTTGAIQLWLYPTELNSTFYYPLSKANGTNNTNGYMINLYGTAIYVGISNATETAYVNTTISTNSWQHFVMTWNASTLYLYKNAGTPLTTASIVPVSNVYDLWIGNDSQDNAYGFKGRIDEVAIWNRLLSAAEVASLYASGSGLAYPFS